MHDRVGLETAAERLDVFPGTLRRWAVRERRIPFYRIGKRLEFSVADLDRFVEEHRVEAVEQS